MRRIGEKKEGGRWACARARGGGSPRPARQSPAGQSDTAFTVPQKCVSPLPCPSQEDTPGWPLLRGHGQERREGPWSPCGPPALIYFFIPLPLPHPPSPYFKPHTVAGHVSLLHLFWPFPCCKSCPKYCSQLTRELYRSQITLPGGLSPAQHPRGCAGWSRGR